ncbi:ferrochelatase [Thermomicrobium sp. 4228-Ro]|uniref:ferrochelatase n=1 Tax=Thermomicrobium sp. 4228-Ro TaxID=2993937 RepID=UPI0022497B84|nr:ferrochelatase [Thermomicrobium sp. 4228-Ro]MCX2726605.1 ferrochelatase [Thermomicrobium sp. 4228-Ro]
MSMVPERVAVLLMAYGGPNSLDDLPAYLADVRHGRPYSAELLADLTERYRMIGGRSPILELTRAQAEGVQQVLESVQSEDGVRYRVYVGMRHWHPYIREVVPEILRDGADRLVAVVMAPHYSRMSVGAYLARLDEALREHGATLPVHAVESWKDEPDFIAAWVERIEAALAAVPAGERDSVVLLFTAHSLPTRILEWGDPYEEEILTSVRLVAQQFPNHHWRFAFQSQGASEEPWLGPTVEETLDALAAEGVRRVLLVPIGFVCDHVEVLYDVDIAHQQYAAERGIVLERPAMLNDHPLLCRAIATAVRRTLQQARSVTG